MKREIKFRAWLKNQTPMALKEHFFPMYYLEWPKRVNGINWWDMFDGKPRNIQSHTDQEFVDSTILMQFTGLLDKNGKEIYEGDIITWDREDIKKEPMEVIWNDAGFSTVWNPLTYPPNDDPQTEFLEPDDDWLIIGNIYENPELLNNL